MFGVWVYDKVNRKEKMVFFCSITDCLAYAEGHDEYYITDEPIDSIIVCEEDWKIQSSIFEISTWQFARAML